MRKAKENSDRTERFDGASWQVKLKWRLAAFVLALVGAATLTWELSGLGPAERESHRVYRRLEASGTPLNHKDFVASFAADEKDNCAEELMPILERFRKTQEALDSDEAKHFGLKVSEVLAGKRLKLANELVATLGPIADEISVAIRNKSRFVPEKDWRRGETVMFEENSQIRRVVKFWAVRATLYAMEGERAKAASDLKSAQKLAHLASDQPTLIGSLVEVACRAITIGAAATCMQVNPEGAMVYADALGEGELRSIGRALRGEAYYTLSSVRDLDSIKYFRGESHMAFEDVYVEKPPPATTSGLPKDPIVRAFAGRM